MPAANLPNALKWPAIILACFVMVLAARMTPARGKPPMTIAVLHAAGCVDAAHLKSLEALGKLTVYEDTDTPAKLRERLRGVKIAVVQSIITPLDASALDGAKSLELIVVCTTGYDLVDLEAANRNKIQIANLPGYSTEAVAEQATALMLAVSRRVPAGDAAVRRNIFQVGEGVPAHEPFRGFDLAGKTLGIVGFGRIGSRVAEIARGLGMQVLIWDRSPKDAAGVTQTTIEDLLKQSDVVSLHLALTKDTANFLNASRLALMKPTAILINTARGKLVDEPALYEALRAGKLAGAGLDVLDDSSAANPLLQLQNVVFSPHSGYFTADSMVRRSEEIVATVKAFVDGSPINIVSAKLEPRPR